MYTKTGKLLWHAGVEYEQHPRELMPSDESRVANLGRGRSLREDNWNAYRTQREATMFPEEYSGAFALYRYYVVRKHADTIVVLEYDDDDFVPVDPGEESEYAREHDWYLCRGVQFNIEYLDQVVLWMSETAYSMGDWKIEFTRDTLARDEASLLNRELKHTLDERYKLVKDVKNQKMLVQKWKIMSEVWKLIASGEINGIEEFRVMWDFHCECWSIMFLGNQEFCHTVSSANILSDKYGARVYLFGGETRYHDFEKLDCFQEIL